MAMGGYKPKRKVFHLVDFEDHPGLEVMARGVNAGQFLEIVTLAGRFDNLKNANELTEDDAKAIKTLFSEFAKVLKSWNLQDEDDEGNTIDVPPTAEGLLSQDLDLTMDIIGTWIGAVGGVDEETGKGSSSGGTSPVEPPPMEALSPNRMS